MNTIQKIKYLGIAFVVCLFSFGCVDELPLIESLPNPDVAFTYSVIDSTYRIDYYVGATIQFVSKSAAKGNCTWDFGDGNTAAGNTVTHKYPVAGTYNVKLTVEGAGSFDLSDIYK